MAKPSKSRTVEMPRDEFEREHQRLVRVLRSGTKREREREATGQAAELQDEATITRAELMEGWDTSSEGYKLRPTKSTEHDLENAPHFTQSHYWHVLDDSGHKIASVHAQPKHKRGGEKVGVHVGDLHNDPESLAKAYGWKRAFTTDAGQHFEHVDHPGHELVFGDEKWTHWGPPPTAPWHLDDEGNQRPEAEGQNWLHYQINPDLRGHLRTFHRMDEPTYNHVELDVSTSDEHPDAASKPETDAGPKFELGAHLVRRALQHLAKNVYPNAETFGGSRSTGASPGTYQLMHRKSILRGMPEARYETVMVAEGCDPYEVLETLSSAVHTTR